MSPPLIIGVVGGSGSGKTTVPRGAPRDARLERDVVERGRSMPDVIRQYLTTVRPMHLEFVEPSKRCADMILPEGGHNRIAVEMIIARVMLELQQRRGGAA